MLRKVLSIPKENTIILTDWQENLYKIWRSNPTVIEYISIWKLNNK